MNYIAIGGGTNSLAMIIEMHRRGIDIDVCIFADTKAERPETYDSIKRTSEWLVSKGYNPIVIVSAEKTLEDDCLNRNALPSVAYGFKTCSQRFKLAPQDKWANNYEPFKEIWKIGGKVTKFIGYDAGEERRAVNAAKYNRMDKKYNYAYPLIDWGIDRDMCIEIIQSEGLPLPGKSSCFFCPNMKKSEIVFLKKKHPDLYERAIEIERGAELQTVKGLGRNYSWEEFITAKESQITMCDMFDDDNDMPCDCYDG